MHRDPRRARPEPHAGSVTLGLWDQTCKVLETASVDSQSMQAAGKCCVTRMYAYFVVQNYFWALDPVLQAATQQTVQTTTYPDQT